MDFPGEENGEISFLQLHKVLFSGAAIEHYIVLFPAVLRQAADVFHIRVPDGFPAGAQHLDVDVLEMFFRLPVFHRFRFIFVHTGEDVLPGQGRFPHRQFRHVPFRQQFQGFFHRSGELTGQPVQMVQISCNHAFPSLGKRPSSLVYTRRAFL